MMIMYHFYCDGFEKTGNTVEELQNKIDDLKARYDLVGHRCVVTKFVNHQCVATREDVVS